MLSLDTNILFHALTAGTPQHSSAAAFLESLQNDEAVAICELVLVELYRLLRNPALFARPLNASDAAGVMQQFRRHPRWKIIGFPHDSARLHDQLWELAGERGFAYRRVFDVRLALVLRQQGVTRFATENTKDFAGLGFEKVWNPLR